MLDNRLFTKKLFLETENSKRKEVYAKILNCIFFDVQEVNNFILGNYYEFNNLGEFFSNKHRWFGIYNIQSERILTMANFKIELYDDKIVCKTLCDGDVIKELCSEKFQKRYINAMYKIFGNSYKSHYISLKENQIRELEESKEFIC